MKTVIEVLKQKVTTVVHKIHRYDNCYLQYHQNHVFWSDSMQVFYPKATVVDVPEPAAALEFWKGLWEKTTVHNGDADWLKSVEAEFHSLLD